MRKLDFISKSPNFYIFKESANKTNLGGVLFLVHIIIIVLLAIVYFYDYSRMKNILLVILLYKKNIIALKCPIMNRLTLC